MGDRPLDLIPITLREANDFVASYHRHNGRTTRNGGKFAIGVSTGEELVGVAIIGRPVARLLNDVYTAEVLRVCTSDESPKNCCSKLYAAAWRAWKAMGGRRLITYILANEAGSSVKAAGWREVASCGPAKNGWDRQGRARNWQPIYGQQKFRWEAA